MGSFNSRKTSTMLLFFDTQLWLMTGSVVWKRYQNQNRCVFTKGALKKREEAVRALLLQQFTIPLGEALKVIRNVRDSLCCQDCKLPSILAHMFFGVRPIVGNFIFLPKFDGVPKPSGREVGANCVCCINRQTEHRQMRSAQANGLWSHWKQTWISEMRVHMYFMWDKKKKKKNSQQTNFLMYMTQIWITSDPCDFVSNLVFLALDLISIFAENMVWAFAEEKLTGTGEWWLVKFKSNLKRKANFRFNLHASSPRICTKKKMRKIRFGAFLEWYIEKDTSGVRLCVCECVRASIFSTNKTRLVKPFQLSLTRWIRDCTNGWRSILQGKTSQRDSVNTMAEEMIYKHTPQAVPVDTSDADYWQWKKK